MTICTSAKKEFREYGYDSFFCIPGIEGAHEKGGVEGEIGRFRRRHLTPVPHLPSLAALNEALRAADARDDARLIGARKESVGAAAAREAPLLNPLPHNGFDATLSLSCRVDAKARVCVRQCYYSVPARYVGRRLDVRLGARTVVVLEGGAVVAQHIRSLHRGSEDLVLDHYLEVLTRKPGALAGATALVRARAAGSFTGEHQRFWDGARKVLGDQGGTRALVGVLLLHRTLPPAAVTAGMAAAVGMGRFDADLVAVEDRRAMVVAQPSPQPVPLPTNVTGSVSLARPAPSLAGYDQLLAEVQA